MTEDWPEWMYAMEPFNESVPIAAIKRAICETFAVHGSDLVSQKRSRRFAYPRQAGMALATTLTRQSLPQIGLAFGGRDHTTVMHAQKAVRQRIDADPEFCALVKKARLRVMDMLNQEAEIDDLADLLMERLRARLRNEIEKHPDKVIKRLIGDVL